MNLSIVIPNRGDKSLENTINRIIDTGSVIHEIIVVNDGSESTIGEMKYVKEIDLEESVGTSMARHIGIMHASSDYIFTIDSHMDFLDNDWDKKIRDELSKSERDVLCCRMITLGVDNSDIQKAKKSQTGARIVVKYEDVESCENFSLSARWADNEIGEIPCIMGGCYALRRSWYIKGLDMPWSLGCGWGLDEETLSITNWICGGKNRLIDVEVGHIFNTPRSYVESEDEITDVWVNRMRMVRVLPMSCELRSELMSFLSGSLAAKVNKSSIENGMKLIEGKIIRHGKFLIEKKRTVDDFIEYFECERYLQST